MRYIKRHFKKDDYLGRNGWYKKDIETLKKSYKSYPVKYPEWLIERHGKNGCQSKACKLGLTKGLRNPGLDLRKLTIAERAYIAGIIDGEGSIIMNYDKPKTNPAIQVANTNETLMNWLLEKITAGNKTVVHRNRHNPKWQDVYQLYINGIKNVYDICQVLLPYLIIKKEKAEKAITFLKNKYNLE